MRVAITNIGTILSGDWRAPFAEGDAVVCEDGLIESVGAADGVDLDSCDVVIDAGGATVAPGLIDSHVHLAFGDFTPRQNTVGYLESYVHGGTTTVLSAGEVHIPGRPTDVAGVKALAVAAHKCYENYRPGGMRVHAGSLLLEPGLTPEDFAAVRADGVWLTKAGFGAVESAKDYVELVAMAKEAGLVTTLHTGGCSIPGTFPVTGRGRARHRSRHLVPHQRRPGRHRGPLLRRDRRRDSDGHAGVRRGQPAHWHPRRRSRPPPRRVRPPADRHRHPHRQRDHAARECSTRSSTMAAVSDLEVTDLIGAATGNVARVFGLNNGLIAPGRDADFDRDRRPAWRHPRTPRRTP